MDSVRIVSQTAQSSPAEARPALRADSVVTARVVRQTGLGRYVISVAGRQLAVQSRVPLQTGATFSARISVRDGQVIFSLTNGAGEVKPLVSQFSAFSLQTGAESPLAQLLASLGLPATAESFGLLQFAERMGMKIDARQLRRALAVANMAGGGEEMPQMALVLDEKGADAVRFLSDGGGSGKRRQQDENEKECPPQEEDTADMRSDSVGNAESSLLPQCPDDDHALLASYFASVDEAAAQNEAGRLTLFNMLRGGARASDAARWVILPFEWTLGYRGDIRLLTDAENTLQEIIVNAKNPHTQWHVVVYCPHGAVTSVRFSHVPELDAGQAAAYAARLQSMLLPSCASLASVDYVAGLGGFCTQDTEIGTVGGEI